MDRRVNSNILKGVTKAVSFCGESGVCVEHSENFRSMQLCRHCLRKRQGPNVGDGHAVKFTIVQRLQSRDRDGVSVTGRDVSGIL